MSPKRRSSEFGFYEWSGSTIEYHRHQIRTRLGFRTCTTEDAAKLAVWPAGEVAHAERRPERVREELLKHLREERIEPPAPGRISRIVASALHNAEVAWSVRIASRWWSPPTERTRSSSTARAVTSPPTGARSWR
ncbi:DUF4158 domain-containing protein [Nonomuraea sp. CA-218870]|uniref:DUF4158 domain-containing protein n=1 Tax=Nonomuraea sp. CA-218870 TaxID=3239998 RepID=UPI003D8D871C